MTKVILAAVTVGIISGYTWIPDAFIDATDLLLKIFLCILLVFVGIDLGKEGTVGSSVKQAGPRLLLFPVAVFVGTLLGCAVGSLFLPIGFWDSLMVGSGFGWYTLSPVLLADYSTEVAAIAFMHNVFRELVGIILIPIVAKYIGYIECVSLPGAAAMDVCLPIVDKATQGKAVAFSFVTGVVLSIAVPAVIPILINLVS